MEQNNQFFGIVIRVKNIDLCRAFYRDVIGLGAPVMDSNFWIEFSMEGGGSVCLEKIEHDENVSDPSGRIAWILHVPDVAVFAERMEKYGYHELSDSSDRFGYIVKQFKDPEGNSFLVSALRQREL